MTDWDVFLCHSKKDRNATLALCNRLASDGFRVWLDEFEILPGQRWESAIEDGIRQSAILLVCFSSRWVNDRSYAHREYRFALEVMRELPDDSVFIIPARLDDCKIPRSLRHLQWVDLFTSNGYDKLKKSLSINIKSAVPVSPATGKDAVFALAKQLGFEVLEFDPFEGDDSEQQILMDFFQENSPLTRSHDYLETGDYPEIIKMWEPLRENCYFNVNHEAWRINSLVRAYIFRAKTDLCTAHICTKWSGLAQVKPHLSATFDIISELVQMAPFTDQNSDLTGDVKRIQNCDYRDLCSLVLKWDNHWGTVLSDVTEIPAVSVRALMIAVASRLSELHELVGG